MLMHGKRAGVLQSAGSWDIARFVRKMRLFGA